MSYSLLSFIIAIKPKAMFIALQSLLTKSFYVRGPTIWALIVISVREVCLYSTYYQRYNFSDKRKVFLFFVWFHNKKVFSLFVWYLIVAPNNDWMAKNKQKLSKIFVRKAYDHYSRIQWLTKKFCLWLGSAGLKTSMKGQTLCHCNQWWEKSISKSKIRLIDIYLILLFFTTLSLPHISYLYFYPKSH